MMTLDEETHLSTGSGTFITFEDLRVVMGIPQRTLDDRLIAEGITIFTNPRDRRRRMIRTADLGRLTAPQPTTRRRGFKSTDTSRT